MSGQGILTLDLASLCGWARYIGGKLDSSGVWDLRPKRGEGPGARMVKLNAHLAALNPRPALIVYEDVVRHTLPRKPKKGGGFHPAQMATKAAHSFGALKGKMYEYAEVYSIPCEGINLMTIKKQATDNGHAKKPEMMAAAAERWGVEVTDDNHGDALCTLTAHLKLKKEGKL